MCAGFGHSFCWVRHARKSACSYIFGQFVVPQLPPVPEAGIYTYVRLTSRERAQAWQRCMLNNQPLVRNLSVLDTKVTNWLRCNRWARLIDTDKNLGTALVESQWIEDQVQFWLNKMTRHITEAEASQKIIAGAQTLGVITDRAFESSVIEEKQKSFLLVNSSSTSAPSFRILAKIHKQPMSSRPIGNLPQFLSRNSWSVFEFLPSTCGQELQACHWFA